MKRLWLSTILLIFLLGIGIWSCIAINRVHGKISEDLSAAQAAAHTGNWAQADAFFRKAQVAWEKYWHITATLSDHEPMEKIDGLFAQLNVYLHHRDRISFCACCALLRTMTNALGEDHVTSWWNLL